jgi:hypothetical protein
MNAGKRLMWESYLFQIIWEELYGNYHYRANFSFELQIIISKGPGKFV